MYDYLKRAEATALRWPLPDDWGHERPTSAAKLRNKCSCQTFEPSLGTLSTAARPLFRGTTHAIPGYSRQRRAVDGCSIPFWPL